MRCEDVRLELEPLAAGELSPKEREAVQSHLKCCPGCAWDYQELQAKGIMLGQHRPQGRAPAALEEAIRQRFKQRYQRPKLRQKTALAALLVLAVLGTVYAQVTIDFISNWRADRGVEHAIIHGAGQIINQQKTVNGLTYSLHSVISDSNRTVVLFTIEGAPVEANSVNRINCTLISPVREYSASYWFDNGVLRGQLETADRTLGDEFAVEFSGISFSRLHELTFPLKLHDLDTQTVALDHGAGTVTLEGMIKNGELTITADPSLKESYLQDVWLYLQKDGAYYRPIYARPNWATWAMDSLEGSYTLFINYEEILTEDTTEPVTFNLHVDSDEIEQDTVITTLNKTIELVSGVDLDVERITSTSSQSVLEYRVNGDNIKAVDITLLQDGKEVWIRETHLWVGDRKTNRLTFDPTVPLERLEFVVNGFYLEREGAVQYNLTPNSQGSVIDFHGISLLVEEIDTKEPGTVRCRLRALDNKVLIDSATLIVGGKGVEPTQFAVVEPVSGDNYQCFEITFPSTETENWTLELGPVWQEYRNSSMTVQIP